MFLKYWVCKISCETNTERVKSKVKKSPKSMGLERGAVARVDMIERSIDIIRMEQRTGTR